MNLPIFQRTIADASGNIQPGATVEVRRESDNELATIYFDRAGTVLKGNPFTADSAGLAQFYATTGEYKITVTTNTGSVVWRYVALGVAGELKFVDAAGVQRAVIDASGSFGLGVTPSAWGSANKVIDVNTLGAISVDSATVRIGNNGYEDSGGTFRYKTTGPALIYGQNLNIGHFWTMAPSGTAGNAISFTQAMTLDWSGNLLVGYTSSNGAYRLQVNSQIFATSSTIATSDGRYKEDVTPLAGALADVCALNPVQFKWKHHRVHAFDTSTPTVGFIAQEVQQVFAGKPYLNSIIKSNECTITPEEKDDEGNVITTAVTEEFLGIAEGNMIALLTAAIKEQNAIITALTARVAALEDRV